MILPIINPNAICKKEKSDLKLIPGTFKKVKLEVSVAIMDSIIKYQGRFLSAKKKSFEFLVLLKYSPTRVIINK